MLVNDKFWYDCPKDDLASTLFSHVEALDSQLVDYRSRLLEWSKMYSGRDEVGYDWKHRFRASFSGPKLFNNVVRQVIDTAGSVVAKSSVRLRVQTRDADWSEIILAKKIEKFLWGDYVFHNEASRMARLFFDGAIYGTGCVRVRIVDGVVHSERVLTKDLIVDEASCSLDGQPLDMFHRRLVNKEVLKVYYPKFVDAIDQSSRRQWADNSQEIPDGYVLLLEAWRLPVGKRPGKYVCAIEGAVLHSEEYEYKKFPFIFYHWKAPETGFYGTGIAYELEDHQARLIEVDDRIARSQDLVAVPMGFLPEGSHMLKDQITNDIARLYRVSGSTPQFVVPMAVNAEMYNYRANLISECFQIVGLSQLSAQAMAPPNIESRAALRELDDVQNTRFIQEVRRFERSHMELGWRRLEASRDLYMGRDVEGLAGEIEWKSVSEYENRYSLAVAPASIMSETPAGRMDMVRELSGVVQMDPQEVRFLLGNPDLEFSNSLSTADYEHAIRVIEKLSEGAYEPPDILSNPELHIRIVTQGYTRAKNAKDTPEDVLEAFRSYLAQCAEFAPAPPPAPTAADAAAQAGQSIAPPVGAPPDLMNAGF
jgi:hypothetical protein